MLGLESSEAEDDLQRVAEHLKCYQKSWILHFGNERQPRRALRRLVSGAGEDNTLHPDLFLSS